MAIRKGGRRNALIYTCAAVAIGVYGIPRLPHMTHGVQGTFSVVWILFLALCIGANLYFSLGTDKERARQLEEQLYAESNPEHVAERVRARG
jgi:hypothetical protein